jgi:hypothetical protein
MALRFVESFDHYAIGDITEKWSSSGGSTGSSSFSSGRTGNGLFMTISSGYARHAYKNFSDNQNTIVFGCAIRFSNLGSRWFMLINDGGTVQTGLLLTAAGEIRVYRGQATILGTTFPGTISAGQWYFMECKIVYHQSAGTVELRVNEETLIDLTGQDTCQGANEYFNRFYLYCQGSGSHNAAFDDLYILDGQAGLNDFVGDSVILPLFPDGAGNYAQFTPSAGNNYENVDDSAPDDDGSYNGSSVGGNKDSFTYDDLPGGIAGTVLGIQVPFSSKLVSGGAINIRPFLRISAADYSGASGVPGATYQYVVEHTNLISLWEDNPATASAFLVSEINALEAGYEHV